MSNKISKESITKKNLKIILLSVSQIQNLSFTILFLRV